MQNIKQFFKERQEIKSLQTCEFHFFTFPTKIWGVSVIRFALQKTVQVDTRFYPDTDEVLLCMCTLASISVNVAARILLTILSTVGSNFTVMGMLVSMTELPGCKAL